MNIVWFVSSLGEEQGTVTSSVDNIRLRCLQPAYALEALHSNIKVFLVELQEPLNLNRDMLDRTQVAIFGKVFSNWESVYQYLNDKNIPIILDVCDTGYRQEHQREPFEVLNRYSQGAVASSEQLAQLFNADTQKSFHIVPDCMDGEKIPPTIKAIQLGDELNLLWYGERADLKDLTEAIPSFSQLQDYRLNLNVLIRLDGDVLDWFNAVKKDYGDLVNMTITAYSADQPKQALALCDIVIVPQTREIGNEVHASSVVKAALWAGKPCVAYPLDSCQSFSTAAELDNDIVAALKRVLAADIETQQEKILSGQELIATQFSAEVVAEQWLSAVNSVL